MHITRGGYLTDEDYMTQQLLSVQKHLSLTLQWLCWLQVHVFTWWTITPYPWCHCFHIHHHHQDWCYNYFVYDMEELCVFPNILSGYFQHVSSVLVSHPLLQVISNFWRCIPAVMFSCVSLFNSDSCELCRLRSQVWRPLNCMTMISQYTINFVDISLRFCGRINWQVIFAHRLIRHYTLPAEPYHACFYYASWQWSVNLETVIGRII